MKNNQIIEDLAMIARNAIDYIIQLENKVHRQQTLIKRLQAQRRKQDGQTITR